MESKILEQEIVSESKDVCMQCSPLASPRFTCKDIEVQISTPEKEFNSVQTQSAQVNEVGSPKKSLSTVQSVIAEMSISPAPEVKQILVLSPEKFPVPEKFEDELIEMNER